MHIGLETRLCRLIRLLSLFPLYVYMAAIVLSISECAAFLFTTDSYKAFKYTQIDTRITAIPVQRY